MKYSYFIHLPVKMEPTVSSKTSAIRTQMPGNRPIRNKLHLEHGESLKTHSWFMSGLVLKPCIHLVPGAGSLMLKQLRCEADPHNLYP